MTIRDIGILFGYKIDESSERKVEGSIKSLKSMASKALGAIGITLSVAGVKSAIDSFVEVASSVEEMQNKFDVVFGETSDEVNQWAQDYSDAIGRNKDDIKAYLADQQNLLVGFGMTREAGAQLSEQMTTLALDLASFGNLDETASVNNMTKAVMGESEAAKSLGAVLNDSTRAQAMATLGLSGTYDKLDQLTKMQVNYQAILSQSSDAIGDCQRSLESYESTKKRYIAKLKEIKTIIGQFFLPTYQKILSFGARGLTMVRDWLQKLTELTDKLGGSQRVIAVVAGALAAMFVVMNIQKITAVASGFMKLARALNLGAGKALLFFGIFLMLALAVDDFIAFMRGDNSLLGAMLERAGVDCDKLRENIIGTWNKIKEAIGYIADGIRNVVVPIFEGIRSAIGVAFDAIQEKVNQVAPGIAQFFKELSSGKVDKKKWTDIGESIGRIAVGVVAVIAAVKGISAIISIILTIISVVKTVIAVLKLGFVIVKSIIVVIKVAAAVISILAGAFGPVIAAIAAAIAIGVLLWKNWDKIKEAALNLLSGIKSTIGKIRDVIVQGFQDAIDWIKALPAQAVQWGADIIDGIVSGITSAVGKIGKAASNVASKIRSFLGFSEPEDGPLSDFHTYMPDMIDLMVKGIAAGKRKVSDALKGITGDMSLTVKSVAQPEEPETDDSGSTNPNPITVVQPDKPQPMAPAAPPQTFKKPQTATVKISWPEEKNEAPAKPDTGLRDVLSDLGSLTVKGIAAWKRKVSDALKGIIGDILEPQKPEEEPRERDDSPMALPCPTINIPEFPEPSPTTINWPKDNPKPAQPKPQTLSLGGAVSGIIGGVVKAVAAGKQIVSENRDSNAAFSSTLSGIKALVGSAATPDKAAKVLPETAKNITNSSSTVKKSIVQNVNISNQFNGDRAGQQKSSKAMDKAAEDTTGELARALAFAR
jgi:hypothetical protein